jgi:tRNA (mo5U34)-methyltransferase
VQAQQTTYTAEQVRALAASVPNWFHSMDLGHGVVTKGHKPAATLEDEWRKFRVPDLAGKTVLDINTWDGWFAFRAERSGAQSVTALDFYMWAMDLAEHFKHWREHDKPVPYHETPYFKPDLLPGKKGFDVARQVLGSKVRDVVGDFMTCDLAALGRFDVVFYLGTLYHMENPFESIRRLARVTRQVAIIETEAIVAPRLEDEALCAFFESDELNHDISNWWAPNLKALTGMCRAAGFARTEVVVGPKPSSTSAFRNFFRTRTRHFRAAIHAYQPGF